MPDIERNGRSYSFTDRRVLRMMARGERTKTIAAVLGVTSNAVSHRVTKIGDKLGTATPAQTLLEAYIRGLVEMPGPRFALHTATVADRPGFVWWQHMCTALEAFAVGVSPADTPCSHCKENFGDDGGWRPVWVGKRSQEVTR